MQNSWLDRIILLCCLALGLGSQAQHYNLPLDNYSKLYLLRSDSSHLSAFQGLPSSWVAMDTIKGFEPRKRYYNYDHKLHEDHLINVRSPEFTAHIDLLLNFELGEELRLDNTYQDTTRMSRNMRGFIIRGNIGEKFSFETSFREFQSFVPFYLYNYTEATKVMPGTGRVKQFGGTGRDHNIAEGYLSYSPAEWCNVQFGTQKNFIGNGYRSLLLSDNAFTYPQLKASFKLMQGKLRYHVIHAWLQTFSRLPQGDTPESLFIRKGGSFKYLEISPIEQLSLGLFEGVMWDRFDNEEGIQAGNSLAYSPLIGTATAALGLDDVDDNAILGLDLGLRPIPALLLYGQYVLDQDQQDGFQVGFRTIDLGLDGLSLRAEYNSVAAFTYANADRFQGYTHVNQALGHPMGAAFDELHLDLLYVYNRWFVHANYSGADQLVDPSDSECTTGSDVLSGQACTIADTRPYEARLEHLDIRLGRMFNPKSNFNAYLGWMFRERTGAGAQQRQSMLKFGIEMSLFNSYEDF